MDNRIFNVNGKGKDSLACVLRLAFAQEDTKACKAWAFSLTHGIILLWDAEKGSHRLPAPLSPEATAGMVWAWLSSEEAAGVICEGADTNMEHDGNNSRGWRVYCEAWGHVGEWRYSIVAVKPAYLWYGK